jgi:exosortase A
MSSDAIAQGNPALARLETWKLHLAALAAVLLALGAVFFADIAAALNVWWVYPAYSHCFLIIPISAWLIWERRPALLSDTPASTPVALLGAIPFLALWFVGRFASITEFRQFALVGLAEVAIIAILGWHIFRKISFACLYLFFLVPTGQYLIPPLQEITAKFVDVGLTLFSIPYYRDGLIFDLVNGRYEIAEACAGLRFLIATVALGVLFAHMMYRRPWKIAAFLAACIVFPIIGNGIRALLTVMVANYTSNRVAAGFDHIVYGWVFAVTIIFIVMYVGSKFRDTDVDAPLAPGVARPMHVSTLLATALGALALLSIPPAISHAVDGQPVFADQAKLDDAVTPAGWRKLAPAEDWAINFDAGAASVSAGLARANGAAVPVDVNIQYYNRTRDAASLLSARNHAWRTEDWHATEHRAASLDTKGTRIPFDEAVINNGDAKRLVWTTYWIDGRYTTSSLMVRLLEFKSGIVHGHSAVLAFSTPITSTTAEARQRIEAAVAAYPDLSASLTKVGDAPAKTL